MDGMRLRWFRGRFAPKAPDVKGAHRDEVRPIGGEEITNSLRNSLIEKAIQRDLTAYVCVIVAVFAIGMFLTAFYSVAYVLMLRFNAVIERAAG
jgi:hypothetical protein